MGLYTGEEALTVVRIATTVISITVTSAWFSSKKIKKLSLFFAHWLAGLVAGLGYLVEGMMVSVCWTGSNLEGFIKALKFIELSAFNMFAVTNLAICINLALIVSSHRTMSRVKSLSSAPLLLVFMLISVALAAPFIPLAETTIVGGTDFHTMNNDQSGNELILVLFFYVEFFVGACMFVVVAWLLLFRLKEIKECWRLHARIRFYFGLTVVGIAVNLGLGISGAVNVLADKFNPLVIVWSWAFRYVHVALDTIVLYGALRERNMDERGDGHTSTTGSGSRAAMLPSGASMPGGSGATNDTSKAVTASPPVV
eukprot:g7625.t1